jgi:hypothetical protein
VVLLINLKVDKMHDACPIHGGGRRIAYKDVVRKPEGKKLFQRLRSKLEYNIKMDIKGTGWEGTD